MILLDTCVLSRILDGRYVPKVEFRISAVTYGEALRYKNDALQDMLFDFRPEDILPYTHIEARLFSRFADRITAPKRVADMMIVATALSSGLKLVTADRRMAALQAGIGTVPGIPSLAVEIIGS